MLPDHEQAVALAINAGFATFGNFCFMMGVTVAGPVPIIVANAVT